MIMAIDEIIQREDGTWERPDFNGHKPIKLIRLVYLLVCALFRFGNVDIYYHICRSEDSFFNPIEVETVDMRIDKYGQKKLTIW